jgi:phosphoribosylanthranilate isomerase
VVKVKICGFTRGEDVKAACSLGVDMVGVILVPKSPRYVPVERARKILKAAGEETAKVAVFIPGSPEDVEEIYRKLEPDYLQFHLTFPTEELLEIKEDLEAEIIVVVPIPRKIERHTDIVDRAIEVADVADFVLIDTKGPTGGGTSLTHDWSLSAVVRDVVDKPVFLAGGLNPSNVGDAIKIVRPYGVDVATGVESSPGKKDPKLMREFIKAARGAK